MVVYFHGKISLSNSESNSYVLLCMDTDNTVKDSVLTCRRKRRRRRGSNHEKVDVKAQVKPLHIIPMAILGIFFLCAVVFQ